MNLEGYEWIYNFIIEEKVNEYIIIKVNNIGVLLHPVLLFCSDATIPPP